MMHPCIRDLCIKFYYGAKHPVAKVFSDEFKTIIPENAIALAATCVRHPFALSHCSPIYCLFRYITVWMNTDWASIKARSLPRLNTMTSMKDCGS